MSPAVIESNNLRNLCVAPTPCMAVRFLVVVVHNEGVQYKSQEFYGDGGKYVSSASTTKENRKSKRKRKCRK